MEVLKQLTKDCIAYCKNHLVLTAILAGALVLMLLVVFILICKAAKNKKARKRAAKFQAEKIAASPIQSSNAASVVTEEKTVVAEETVIAENTATQTEPMKAVAKEEKAEEPVQEMKEPIKAEVAQAPVEEKAIEEKPVEEKPAVEEREIAVAAVEEKSVVEEKKTEETQTAAPVAKKTTAKKPVMKSNSTKKPVKTENKQEKQSGVTETPQHSSNKPATQAESEADKEKYSGKWVILRVVTEEQTEEEEEMFFFELRASNGEKLLSSEEYTSYAGALRGIETHKNNILKDNFKITLSKKGDYIFKLLNGKNMLLCMGENYPTKTRCESAMESTKRFAKTAVIDENVQDHVIKIPTEDDSQIEPLADGYNGKWIISDTKNSEGEQVYYFELFANNGEKLLSSEEYTTYIGAINGIETHKNNIAKGNFRISLTKRGDYIYKLLNGNGQLLCLGEHYKTKRRCLNAVESVKRFAANSPLLVSPYLTK